jgi:hypothetical protein
MHELNQAQNLPSHDRLGREAATVFFVSGVGCRRTVRPANTVGWWPVNIVTAAAQHLSNLLDIKFLLFYVIIILIIT